jgi:hypothetical protein
LASQCPPVGQKGPDHAIVDAQGQADRWKFRFGPGSELGHLISP